MQIILWNTKHVKVQYVITHTHRDVMVHGLFWPAGVTVLTAALGASWLAGVLGAAFSLGFRLLVFRQQQQGVPQTDGSKLHTGYRDGSRLAFTEQRQQNVESASGSAPEIQQLHCLLRDKLKSFPLTFPVVSISTCTLIFEFQSWRMSDWPVVGVLWRLWCQNNLAMVSLSNYRLDYSLFTR